MASAMTSREIRSEQIRSVLSLDSCTCCRTPLCVQLSISNPISSIVAKLNLSNDTRICVFDFRHYTTHTHAHTYIERQAQRHTCKHTRTQAHRAQL